jgi:hypothetical protein
MQMKVALMTWTVSAASFLLSVSCGIVSTWLFHLMRSEVNAKLAEEDRIGPLGATPGLFFRVRRIHRDMYPDSRLRVLMYGTIFVGFLSALVLAKSLGALGA